MKKIKWLRKILSLFILAFALVYYFYGKNIILFVLASFFAIFFLFDMIYYFSKGKNKLSKFFFELYPKKKEEYARVITDATIFFISSIILILTFSKEIVILSLILLLFVDAGEQIFGISIKSKKLFWNAKKSWSGTIAGFIISVVITSLFIDSLKIPFKLGGIIIISVVAAIAGTSPRQDNVLIPWSTAIISFILVS